MGQEPRVQGVRRRAAAVIAMLRTIFAQDINAVAVAHRDSVAAVLRAKQRKPRASREAAGRRIASASAKCLGTYKGLTCFIATETPCAPAAIFHWNP